MQLGMGSTTFCGKVGVFVVFASIFAMAATANTNWNFGGNLPPTYNYKHNATLAKKINVGGSQNWRYGFNYTDWAIKNGPFYLGDTLVFKYDPPNATAFPHSVYMLENYRSFIKCDLRKAKKIANVNQGGGKGFQFVIKKWKPYYFACGERAGLHCNNGTMKFLVFPLIHRN